LGRQCTVRRQWLANIASLCLDSAASLDGVAGETAMARVTGLGGVFFKVADPAATRAWYATHLGLVVDDYGATFAADADPKAQTVWSPFKTETDYFGPGEQGFMINFRVDDLDALLASLAERGIACVGEPMDESYGKFGWIIDCDGRKIELWEPKTPL
jgi:predicted enzyme related to lactoylglutathione lyase